MIEIKNIEGVVLHKVEAETLYRADLSGIDLCGAILKNADLREARLDGASLRNASLDGASLDGASLRNASLDGAILDGAILRNANLVGASLRNANLVGASLVGANLDGASLDGACLDGAILVGASLDGARLDGAILVGANLDGASLDGACLKGVILGDDTRMPGTETWRQYLDDVVPQLLTAGGKTVAEIVGVGAWDCHTWANCPMHAALNIDHDSKAPILLRPRVREFVQFFDAGLIPCPVVPAAQTTEGGA